MLIVDHTRHQACRTRTPPANCMIGWVKKTTMVGWKPPPTSLPHNTRLHVMHRFHNTEDVFLPQS